MGAAMEFIHEKKVRCVTLVCIRVRGQKELKAYLVRLSL
jgi:hypothetical protein